MLMSQTSFVVVGDMQTTRPFVARQSLDHTFHLRQQCEHVSRIDIMSNSGLVAGALEPGMHEQR